jgi:hypothetical protein
LEQYVKTSAFQKFEAEILRNERVDIKRNFRLMDALYREAVTLGVMPLKYPLEGLDVDLRIAKAINRVSNTTY